MAQLTAVLVAPSEEATPAVMKAGPGARLQVATLEPEPVQGEIRSLDELGQELGRVFESEKARAAEQGYTVGKDQPEATLKELDAKVRSLVNQYTLSGSQDWHRYAFFNEHHYVRNLVVGNEDFELIVICWKSGQASRVHNHANSHCWLTVLREPMQELQFVANDLEAWDRRKSFSAAKPAGLPGVLSVESPCPSLVHIKTTDITAGTTAYINDNIALHAVRCPKGEYDHEGGVSLHLYSPPIRRVRLFEPASDAGAGLISGRVVERVPGFFTVGGVRTPRRTD